MKFSLVFTVVLAASAEAAVLERRQFGHPDVEECGLDAFEGHTAEALRFCSNILRSGTATATVTSAYTSTTTTTRRVTTTVAQTSSRRPITTPTPRPTSSTVPSPPPPSSVPAPSSAPGPSSSPTPIQPSSTIVSSPSPTPTSGPGCGIVAYVKATPAYLFDSTGTKNTFDACSSLCKADSKCKSFGYGEANCMLFDVAAAQNTNYNPMSPYTFYDAACPAELPVRKRQLGISLGVPGGINISLDLGGPKQISSACSCLITSGPARVTVTRTTSQAVIRTRTATSTVTRTAG